ncbi:MAG TPA: hypothetical protein VML50_05955 [Anaeromyxobacter sp.]|nr:hypothetical protein [Anaeromyxobacter sp.]
MRQRLASFAVLLALACAGPQTTVRTPDTRPALAFEGAPAGAVLFVDGLQIGDPSLYDGQPQVLVVEPGTHLVVIRAADGAVILEQKVYVESEHKTIKVH